jgi:ADP-ribosyl-[dinitrogen reductase] hydrolase
MSQHSGPLQIDVVLTPGGGAIAMVHCPGRCVAPWRRDLNADLAALVAWGAQSLVSLVEGHEFARLGVPQFPEVMRAARLQWYHIPIRDMQAPDAETLQAWEAAGPALQATLRGGGKVAIHCAAGLGRTGTIAAKLLVNLRQSPGEAIAAVRHARPGTIETAAQEAFVRSSGFSIPPATF